MWKTAKGAVIEGNDTLGTPRGQANRGFVQDKGKKRGTCYIVSVEKKSEGTDPF